MFSVCSGNLAIRWSLSQSSPFGRLQVPRLVDSLFLVHNPSPSSDPFNGLVGGSSPAGPTTQSFEPEDFAETSQRPASAGFGASGSVSAETVSGLNASLDRLSLGRGIPFPRCRGAVVLGIPFPQCRSILNEAWSNVVRGDRVDEQPAHQDT